jgi:5-methylcytosine-specific restriction endonuclease McrA
MRAIPSFRNHTDNEVASDLTRLAAQSRCSIVELVACLEEFDRRRLYLPLGFTSIYRYCEEMLHLREGAAYRRIEVARASRRCPELLEMVQDGRLSLATACLIAPRLGTDRIPALLRQAAFKSKREVERLVAAFYPLPPVPSVIRKLPEPKTLEIPIAETKLETVGEAPPLLARPAVPPPPPSSPRPVLAALSEAHYKLQVTISAAARERLQQIQDLMRHRLPNGDPAAIVEHALEVLHAELLKQKAAQVAKPRTGRQASEAKGRYIPASVRREVWRRDQGRCAFRGQDGRTCGSGDGVEFHHAQPYAVGGQATARNIEMRCRAHNGFEWTQHLDLETLALVER